jgi:hypothetical protein
MLIYLLAIGTSKVIGFSFCVELLWQRNYNLFSDAAVIFQIGFLECVPVRTTATTDNNLPSHNRENLVSDGNIINLIGVSRTV